MGPLLHHLPTNLNHHEDSSKENGVNCGSFSVYMRGKQTTIQELPGRRIQVKTKHTISEDWKSIVLE
jgi:hypothetical protein